MAGGSISTVAYYLALIGGILMIVFGLLGVLVDFGGFIFHLGFAYGGIVTLIMGIIAVVGARSASTLVWAIVLIIVGFIGGGIGGYAGLGGLLVILGGVIGLIAAITRKV